MSETVTEFSAVVRKQWRY